MEWFRSGTRREKKGVHGESDVGSQSQGNECVLADFAVEYETDRLCRCEEKKGSVVQRGG